MKSQLHTNMKALTLTLFLLSMYVDYSYSQIISPNGGEVYPVGSTQNITWNPLGGGGGISTSLQLHYSHDSGAVWNLITTLPIATSMYSWLVPNTPSGQCLIKVSTLAGGTGGSSFVSDSVFTITGSTTGIVGPKTQNDLSIFPVPAKDYIFIATASSDIQNVQVYSITGALVTEVNYDALVDNARERIKIPVYHMAEGIYYVKVNISDGAFSQKIVVTK